jgi:hypothetical protein
MLVARGAAAAEDEAPEAADSHLAITGGGLAFYERATPEWLGTVQLAGDYSVSPRWSLGAVTSYGAGQMPSGFLRFSAQGRFHAVRHRWLDLWAAGEAGAAVMNGARGGCMDDDSCPDPHSEVGAIFGLGLGLDVFLSRQVSLGVEGRGLVPFLNRSGLTPRTGIGLFSGLTLAAHL